MGIDGIGKGGGAPKAPDASGDVGKLEKATKTGAIEMLLWHDRKLARA